MVPLDLRAAVTGVNAESRTIELIWSTGADVMRYDWNTGKRYLERLSMDPKAIRLDRLNSGAPLLDSHSAYSIASQLGVVVENSARLEKGEGRAQVRFSKRADVEPFYQDVVDKIIRNVSAGYRAYTMQSLGFDAKSGMEIREVIDWEPFEISMVPMGADVGARVRSSREVPTHNCLLLAGEQERTTQDADRNRRWRLAMAHS